MTSLSFLIVNLLGDPESYYNGEVVSCFCLILHNFINFCYYMKILSMMLYL